MTVLSLEEAQEHLNMSSDDDAFELFGDHRGGGGCRLQAGRSPRAHRRSHPSIDSGGGTLTLPLIPVISLTSLTATYPSVYSPSFDFSATCR
jgi:hypothetical protein